MSTNATLNIGNVVSGSASLPGAVNSTYFYARWVGFLIPTVTGLHTIGVNCQDGCNLYIGKQAIVSDLSGSDVAYSSLAYTESGQIMLTAGVYYELTVEWAHGSGANYQMQLLWTPPKGALAVIPSTSLSTSSTSVSGNLAGAWWNGTPALYYPTGNALVDPSSSGVLALGSMPQSLCPQFSYTSTSTSITFSWGANTAVYRADGTMTYIGASSQTITGLAASTLYNFYPIYDELLGELRFIQTSDITSPSLVGYVGAGTSGYVKTTDSLSNPTNFSIEAWMQGSTVPSFGDVLLNLAAPQTTGSGTCSVMMVWAGSAAALNVYLNLATAGVVFAINYTPPSTLLDGQVHHIVFTWNNSTHAGTLYVDGASVSTYSGSDAMATETGMYWHIGGGYGSNAGFGAEEIYANCWLSNVAVYSTTLTAAQVLANYSAGTNLGQTALAASVAANGASYYWNLTETSGTTAADSAGSNSGTYVATVTLDQSESTHAASGSPAIAWKQNTFLAGQAQIIRSRVPLSIGPIQVTTPATGSGTPGTGGGTGGGGKQYY